MAGHLEETRQRINSSANGCSKACDDYLCEHNEQIVKGTHCKILLCISSCPPRTCYPPLHLLAHLPQDDMDHTFWARG